MSRTDEARLVDMIEALNRIRLTLAGVSLDEFEVDWEKKWLVERGLEIVSEASRHLSGALKARHSNIPWSKVAGIGNVLRHDYERIAAPILWSLAMSDLAILEKVCRFELKRLTD